MGWHLTIMSRETVLFTASTRSRQEIEDLAAAARQLRPEVGIFIRPPVGPAYRNAYSPRPATGENLSRTTDNAR